MLSVARAQHRRMAWLPVRSFASKKSDPSILEADVVEPAPKPKTPPRSQTPPQAGAKAEEQKEGEKKADESYKMFGKRFEHLQPGKGGGLGMLLGFMMLGMAIKMSRDRGEAILREKRYEERLARVKLEVDALEERLVEELRAKGQELPATDRRTAKQFLSEVDTGREWVREIAAKAVARAKQTAKEQFEASLWTDTTAAAPEASASGEQQVAESKLEKRGDAKSATIDAAATVPLPSGGKMILY